MTATKSPLEVIIATLSESLAQAVRELVGGLEAEITAERARTDALVSAINAMRDENYDAAWDSRMQDALDAVAKVRPSVSPATTDTRTKGEKT